jgi:hypothetical protein
LEDLFDMAESVAATLAEAGASPQEIASAMKAALSGLYLLTCLMFFYPDRKKTVLKT